MIVTYRYISGSKQHNSLYAAFAIRVVLIRSYRVSRDCLGVFNEGV
jgi:hypothetical protein